MEPSVSASIRPALYGARITSALPRVNFLIPSTAHHVKTSRLRKLMPGAARSYVRQPQGRWLCRLWSGCILCEAEQSYNEIGALFRASSGPFFANFGA
jgi:hypothetical protein